MRRKMKNVMTLLLTAVMILAMSIPSLAANVTIGGNANDGKISLTDHTFVAYQIFTGTQKEGEEDGHLADVQWSQNDIKVQEFFDAIKKDDLLKDDFTDVDIKNDATGQVTYADLAPIIAEKISQYQNDSVQAKRFAQLAYENKNGKGTKLRAGTSTLTPGYYLIVDTTTGGTDKEPVINPALLQVTGKGDITIAPKVGTPDLEKTRQDVQANINGDYNIGDLVPYSITSTAVDTTQYKNYSYTFVDTMSKGHMLIEDSLKVTIGTGANEVIYVTKKDSGSGKLTVINSTSKEENENINISISKDTAAGTTTIETTVDLRKDHEEIIAENTPIKITYVTVLNEDAVVGNGTDSNDPANWNKAHLEFTRDYEGNTARTPNKKVTVYTFGLNVTKVDGENADTKLPGAEFVLYKMSGGKKKYASVVAGRDGHYKIDADTDKFSDTWSATKPATGNLKVDGNGNFVIDGLDAGTYYLEETKAPAGYNTLKNPITIIVTPTYDDVGKLTALKVTADTTEVTGDAAKGTADITVANNQGPTLPETGGSGTTVLYVAAILLFGMAVFCFMMNRKKREQ